ncbi:protein-tyrosine phosphatase family protein [Streptomyces sp. H39-C1]|uniref:protein-tyrosine phosphatase family protein n=1 Tax=Streptomyces sp. H39-C1 TaxID=3004355 RepID=UPI0022AEEB1C|nr:protein phosphatase [Streptomyces sp. H39-C1]MCZ4103709.1 protein phosphatase [Streptomyces sp. H39-C1]
MKTRQKDRDAPEPQAPWDEVRPGLWMGGHVWVSPQGQTQAAVVDVEFDLVVSLYSREGHGPHPSVEHLVNEIPDSPLTAVQLYAVQQLATTVAGAVRGNRTVLVRCHSGYNRSGLVVAQALIELGEDAAAAIDLIRRNRSPWALNNRTFEQYLTTGLDIACLLAGLETSA